MHTFTGWHVCMRKGAFTLLLRQETTLGLKEARSIMLRVLDEQPVTRELPDEAAVASLRRQAVGGGGAGWLGSSYGLLNRNAARSFGAFPHFYSL